MSVQSNRTETFEDGGTQRAWWDDEYETEESAAFREERDFHDSLRILDALPRPAAARAEPRTLLQVFDVRSERGAMNVLTAAGARGAELRAMREWNVSRFWMEKNASVKYLYSYDPAKKRRRG
jgi:hypothetical protein